MINRINGHVKMLGDLTKYIENLTEENSKLRGQLKNWNGDKEIQKLNDKHRDMVSRSVHIMSDKEMNSLEAFRKLHYDTCQGNAKEIISHSGIGSSMVVQCIKCKTKQDITDFNNW